MSASGSQWLSTRWQEIGDPQQFLLRYGSAVRLYLGSLVRDPHEADEVLQEFMVAVLRHRFATAAPDRGRFRDYLKQSLRHAVADHFQRHGRHAVGGADWDQIADPATTSADRAWLEEWQRCILNRAWRELERHEQHTPGNRFFTLLRLVAEEPDADSVTLATILGERLGQPVRADAVRQQLSRGRRKFAELILAEVRRGLEAPTEEHVQDELQELGLLPFVRDYLKPDGSAD